MTRKNLRILWACWLVVAGLLLNHTAVAAGKPRLVLLPMSLEGDQNLSMASQYGSALQQRLSQGYQVIYGRDVEAELERIYRKLESRIDCDAGLCNREVALAFNSRRVADGSVTRTANGYALMVQIRDSKSGQVLESITEPCRNCDELDVIDKLKHLGQSQTSLVDDQGQSVTPVLSKRAILIIDSQPSGAVISINGKSAGVTPYQGLDHKQGQQLTVTLEKQYYLSKELTIRLSQSITELNAVPLKKGRGELLVLTEPYQKGVSVSLNGNEVGNAPYQETLDVNEYEIHLRFPNGNKYNFKRHVKHGGMTQIIARDSLSSIGLTFKGQSDSEPSSHLVRDSIKVNDELLSIEKRFYNVDGIQLGFVPVTAGQVTIMDRNYELIRTENVGGFLIMDHEVTFELWDECVIDGICKHNSDAGWGRGLRPVINVSWDEINNDFIPWLRERSGINARLPSEGEWERVLSVAGSKIKWGKMEADWCYDFISSDNTAFEHNTGWVSADCEASYYKSTPVKFIKPLNDKFYGLFGNVREWTSSCWFNNSSGFECIDRVVRGGSWMFNTKSKALNYRYKEPENMSDTTIGFRLVVDG